MTLRSLFGKPANLGPKDLRHHLIQLPYLSSFYISSFYLSSPSRISNSSSSGSFFSELRAILFYVAEPAPGPAPDHAELVECGPPVASYECWRIYSAGGQARSPAFSFGKGWGLRSPGASAGLVGEHSSRHLSIRALYFLGWSSYISSAWAICTSAKPASFSGSIICTSTGPEWACTGSLTGLGFLFPCFLNSFIIISSLVHFII